jgi:multimeric flavodoxin WrbA
MKLAVGLFASPRKNSITTSLAKSAIKAFSDSGYEIKEFNLVDMNIKPCTGCLSCETTQKCIINDDQKQILDAIDKSEVVVFSSPVYCSNVTASGKTTIDRFIPLYEKTMFGPRRKKETPKKALLITSSGAPLIFSYLTGMTTGCLKAMKVPFKFMRTKIYSFNVGGFKENNDPKLKKKIDKVYKFAKSLV